MTQDRNIVPLAAALVMACVFLFLPQVLNDGDTWWHMATGEWILAHGRVPDRDVFSYTQAGRPWVAHEWLSEALMALAARAAGLHSSITTDAAELPPAAYDLIFANSVFQYLDGDAGVAEALALFRRLLRPDGRGVVLLADLIPTRYSNPLDACRSLWVAAWHGVLPAMTVFLVKAALNPGGAKLHQLDPARTAALAARVVIT